MDGYASGPLFVTEFNLFDRHYIAADSRGTMPLVKKKELLNWFRANARMLPWRREPRNPYHVVVSEFMLQQTQVDRVVPRFESFVERFPTFDALARVVEEEVLEEWSGLGYYRRARMLHRLAREVVAGPGELPQTAGELVKLPGIGPYTAAAVASLAFGKAEPVLDGNVMRVGARVLALKLETRSAEGRHQLESWISGLMEGESPGQFNEALMELGATVCTPMEPECGQCPFASDCEANTQGRQEDFPPPRRRRATEYLRWVAACVVTEDGSWLVRRVDEGPILRGLWLPPLGKLDESIEPEDAARQLVPFGAITAPKLADAVRHNITHRKIDVIPVRFEVARAEPPSEAWRWVYPGSPGVPTSSLLAKLVDSLTERR
jgi:A/G-specific adenine glycosylase